MMDRGSVRRLVAIDMHGIRGSPRRARVIRAEFLIGAVGCVALGTLSLVAAQGIGRIIGVWLVGIGVNYIPLAWVAVELSRDDALEAELQGVDLQGEARSAGLRQFWIAVPFAVTIMWARTT